MSDYPINHHVLAEDFRGKQEFTQDEAIWLLDSLRVMCESYDELVDERDKLREDIDLSVCYSPDAIRSSFDGADEDHPDAMWVAQASKEQLLAVSYMIVGSDPVWKDFHENIEMCIEEFRMRSNKEE